MARRPVPPCSEVDSVLGAFLQEQGAGPVRIRCASGRPPRLGRSGKLQRVIGWAEVSARRGPAPTAIAEPIQAVAALTAATTVAVAAPPRDAFGVFYGAHEQNRHRRHAHDLFGIAAEHHPIDAAPAVRAHDDEIGRPLARPARR